MSAKLIAVDGLLKGLELELVDAEEWIIGSDSNESHLVLDDPSVSEKQLIIRKQDGTFVAQNLSEASPVTIGDTPIIEAHTLREGEILKIGDSWFQFMQTDDDVLPPSKSSSDDSAYDSIFDEEENLAEESLAPQQEAELKEEPQEKAKEDDSLYDTIFDGDDDFIIFE